MERCRRAGFGSAKPGRFGARAWLRGHRRQHLEYCGYAEHGSGRGTGACSRSGRQQSRKRHLRLGDVDRRRPRTGRRYAPVGIQLGTGANANKAVAFIGTNFFSTANANDLITITTESSVTALAWARFNVDGSMAALTGDLPGIGRIVQGNGKPNGGRNFQELSYASSRASNTGPHFLGDMNGDGKVTNADVVPFGQALIPTTWPAYITANPHLNILRADINLSGTITTADIARFGQILYGMVSCAGSGLASASVPEPASITWIGLAFACFTGVRRRSC